MPVITSDKNHIADTDFDDKIKSIFDRAFSKNRKKIAMAVSGGPDSLALVYLIKKWSKGKKIKLVALSVNHNLRAEAKEELLKVKKWMKSEQIDHHILTWDGGKKVKSNIQNNARKARYTLLTNFCKENDIETLCVGHHLEDQAETVLQRLARGSGLDGLTGMKDSTIVNTITILRPLLQFKKSELITYLQKNNKEWIVDPSNNNKKFSRVKIRKLLDTIEEKEQINTRLAAMAEDLQRTRSYVEYCIEKDQKEILKIFPEGYVEINITKLFKLHEEAIYRILSKQLKIIGGKDYPPRFVKLKQLVVRLKNNKKINASTLAGCRLEMKNTNSLIIYRELNDIEPDKIIEESTNITWDNHYTCYIKHSKKEVLNIGALGNEGLKQVKEFISTNIPKNVLPTLPALKKVEKVVAIPHLKYAESKKYEKILKIKYNRDLNS